MGQKNKEFISLRLQHELSESFCSFCRKNEISESGAVISFIENTINTNEISYLVLLHITKNSVANNGETHKKRKSFRVNIEHKRIFSSICNKIGISMSSAIKFFMLYCVENDKFPFPTP